MSHQPETPFDNIEGSHEYVAMLADSLEEAACCDHTILTHLRALGPHVRGCWVVELLGRSRAAD